MLKDFLTQTALIKLDDLIMLAILLKIMSESLHVRRSLIVKQRKGNLSVNSKTRILWWGLVRMGSEIMSHCKFGNSAYSNHS